MLRPQIWAVSAWYLFWRFQCTSWTKFKARSNLLAFAQIPQFASFAWISAWPPTPLTHGSPHCSWSRALWHTLRAGHWSLISLVGTWKVTQQIRRISHFQFCGSSSQAVTSTRPSHHVNRVSTATLTAAQSTLFTRSQKPYHHCIAKSLKPSSHL